ncbi:MAG: glycosyltransferase family 2 protein [Chloroflexi bacterium]|nr:glycosyltransferase family 2 protein [Chloroflexota bacterium]
MLDLAREPRVVAVICAFNEDKYIASVVLKARHRVDEVLVVDDGSSDLTRTLASEAGATVVTHTVNRGKGAAIKTGLQWALENQAQAAVLLDGDGQHRPDDIDQVVSAVLTGQADMVVGSRFIGRGRLTIPGWRMVGQHGLNALTAITSGQTLTDSQSGFRALSRRAMRVMSDTLHGNGFSVESEMQLVAMQHGLRTVEAPVEVDYDVPLKRNPVAHGLQVIDGMLRLAGQARPLLFLSLPGLILLLMGIALGFAVVNLYAEYRQLAVGYGLVTVLFVVVGVLGLFAGIMLHTIRALLLEFMQARKNE